jgi:hypothetical protein
MFGAAATVSAVAADRARCVTDGFRSMPMAQPAVVVGRSTAGIVNSVLDLAVLVGCGLLVGGSPRTPAVRRYHSAALREPAPSYPLRPTAPNSSTATGTPRSTASGRHSGHATTPGSSSSSPSKYWAISSGVRRV